MKDIEVKVTCPYKSDIKCGAAVNLLCDNLCKYHPRYVEGGSNMNFQTHRCPYSDGTTCSGEDCKSDCFFHPDYMDYIESTQTSEDRQPELAYDNGVVDGINKLEEWYKDGRSVGYERGFAEGYAKGKEDMMIEMSNQLEDAYLDGYKDCFCGEEPMVEDDDIREFISGNLAYSKDGRVYYSSEPEIESDMYVSGKILCMVEEAKERLNKLHSKVLTSGITGEKEQRYGAVDILAVIDILGSVQKEYVSDALYEYLGHNK